MQDTIHSEQQKKEFQFTLSKFAHEIRNPLSLIQSELQMMASSHPEITCCNEWDDILDNLEHIKELLNDVTRYNNAEHLVREQTDLSACLKSITGSFKPSLDYLGIALESHIPDTLPLLFLDRTKIRQAFVNLLRNAQESIQHSHGLIRVSAASVPGGVSVSVSDNGCGMTQSQQKTAFQPFVTYKPNGTGLGLAVTREIIEAHGGELKVQSVPGEGTVFQVFLRG